MSQFTSNHDWEIPTVDSDTDVWGNILNEMFDNQLDEEVILKDTFNNRPSAGSDVVKLYFATDRNILYYNDGSSWKAVAGYGTDTDSVPVSAYFTSLIFNTDLTDSSGETIQEFDDIKGNVLHYNTATELPDPSTIEEPTIAYLESENEYVGVFK